MSKVQNLPVNLKAVDRFLASFQCADMEEAAAASSALVKALKEAKALLEAGYNRKELTVCVGRIGFVAPGDVNRLINGEIPRLTVYRKKKDNHHMPLFYKDTPRFYKENTPCKIGKKRTPSTSTAMQPKSAKPRASSGRKPTKKA